MVAKEGVHARILSSKYWPMNFAYPLSPDQVTNPGVIKCIKEYSQRHPSQRLEWQPQFDSYSVSIQFATETLEFDCMSHDEVLILEKLDEGQFLMLDQLESLTPIIDLQRSLASLVKRKLVTIDEQGNFRLVDQYDQGRTANFPSLFLIALLITL